VTNLQIYWDQILVDNGRIGPQKFIQTELPLALSTLKFRGYPEQIEQQSPADLTYPYDRTATGPFARPARRIHSLRNVTPLLKSVDNHFVILARERYRCGVLVRLHCRLYQPDGNATTSLCEWLCEGHGFYEASPFTVTRCVSRNEVSPIFAPHRTR